MTRTYFGITLEPFVATTLEECAHDSIRIAKLLNMGIEFEYNDHRLRAFPNTTVQEILDYYDKREREEEAALALARKRGETPN